MLLNLNELNKKYNLNITGVIHIGGHHGEEDPTYNSLGIKNVIYFEPLQESFNTLKSRVSPDRILYNVALGNEEREVEMYVEENNQRMSSSILEPKIHLTQYPHIVFNKKETPKMMKLDSIEFNREDYNMINIDVQGYELEVFKGGKKTLDSIDYIISEINKVHLYENGTLITELIDFLKEHNFELVEESWDGVTWGDGLFIKQNKK